MSFTADGPLTNATLSGVRVGADVGCAVVGAMAAALIVIYDGRLSRKCNKNSKDNVLKNSENAQRDTKHVHV